MPFKKKELSEFKNLLITAKNKILEQLNFDQDQLNDLSKKEIGDIVDKAFYMYEKNRTIEMSEKEKQNLNLINRALLRIEKKTFGKCFKCGKEINKNRLLAIPWATNCVNSQECVKK